MQNTKLSIKIPKLWKQEEFIVSDYLQPFFEHEKYLTILKKMARVLKRHKYDALAFRGMSGAFLAIPLSLITGKPLIMVRKEIQSTHTSYMVEGMYAGTYIIVDDRISSGDTCREIVQEIKKQMPDAKCLGALLSTHVEFYKKKDIELEYDFLS
jgi:adenine/guanine phosphoribosyltransferase-like PRPP-binding protein